jgi:hypothetical protein
LCANAPTPERDRPPSFSNSPRSYEIQVTLSL